MKTGVWVGDCFIYTNTVNRLNYYVGGEIVTIAHLDRYHHQIYLLSFYKFMTQVMILEIYSLDIRPFIETITFELLIYLCKLLSHLISEHSIFWVICQTTTGYTWETKNSML